jgi:hypothetical protein
MNPMKSLKKALSILFLAALLSAFVAPAIDMK